MTLKAAPVDDAASVVLLRMSTGPWESRAGRIFEYIPLVNCPWRALVLILLTLTTLVGAAQAHDDPAVEGSKPQAIRLQERARKQLYQLDVGVLGPPELASTLGPQDFTVRVGGTTVSNLAVDNLCPQPRELSAPENKAKTSTPAPASYLFYFDQAHLTLSGRQEGAQLCGDLIQELIKDGSQGLVVSNGKRLRALTGWSDDPAELSAAVLALIDDPEHLDPFAELENSRIRDVRTCGGYRVLSRARGYQAEERWNTERALSRLAIALGQLHDVRAPRAVFYFADTMRRRPGEFYRYFIPSAYANRFDYPDEALGFQRVLEVAASEGIRIYTVQATGLTMQGYGGVRNAWPSQTAIASLTAMARQTGGLEFVNGTSAGRVLRSVRRDLDCMYLLSFDPQGLPLDQLLDVEVEVQRPGVRLRSRGKIWVASESARLTNRLLAAFAAADRQTKDGALSQALIPTGFERGKFKAIVQASLGRAAAKGTWDVGFSVVSRDWIQSEAAWRLSTHGGETPVLERVVEFKPGNYEVVAVAHDVNGGEILSSLLSGQWPDPDEKQATLGPVALIRDTPAVAFDDHGPGRRVRFVGVGDTETVRADAALALIGVVCRGKSVKQPVTLHRELAGVSHHAFPPQDIQFEAGERCSSFRDVVPPGVLAPGDWTYTASAVVEGKPIDSVSRQVAVVTADDAAATLDARHQRRRAR